MPLKQRIEADIKQAMLAKDKDGLRALRAIKALILLEETKEGASGELAAEDETKLLTKAVKQRRDSAEIYRTQNRPDLLEAELTEIAVIERYLPQQLTEEEVKARLREIIGRVGAKSPADLGKVMGAATKELAGLAEGKTISALAKTLLGE
ncbi:MAG: GatB/YqeY domain-containing protein [Ferruginibacter sp.]|nr:GatB/YqeY domain-containing protein [Cytophagales bacterium]